jgi:integrase
MAPRYRVHWDKQKQAWRSDCGEEYQTKQGKARRRPVFFRDIPRADHAAAGQALLDYLKAEEARTFNPSNPTVDDLSRLYLVHSARVSKPRTVEGHREMLLAWCDYPSATDPNRIGLRRARTIAAKDLKRILADWEERGYSAHYRARLARTIKACWNWAATPDEERTPVRLIPENPLSGFPDVTIPHAPERYAERKEVAAFLRYAWRRAGKATPLYRRFGRKLVLLIRVIAHTGCRPSEAIGAEWTELDLERGTITLPPEKTKTGHKTGKPRVIFLPPALARALRRELAKEDRHPTHLFSCKRGKGGIERGATREAGEPWHPKALTKCVRKLRNEAIEAGVPLQAEGDNRFVLYRLRHTRASDDLMHGGDVVTVAALLGTSPRMLETTYGHLLNDHLAKAQEELLARRREARKPR